MRRVIRVALAGALSMALATAAMPAGAHPPESGGDTHSHAHISPGGNSKNMKHMANVPNSSAEFQSDLAFWGKYAFAGNYNGVRVLDVSSPANPKVVADVWCPGPQNDVSVWGDLVVLSVDSVMTGSACGSAVAPSPTAPGGWEGLRFFSLKEILSTPKSPDGFVRVQPLAAPYLDCGSHTHTINPVGNTVYIYNASYSLRSGPTCGPENSNDGANYDPLHGKIGIVTVPVSNPANFTVSYDTLDPATAVWDLLTVLPGFNALRACHDLQVHQGMKLLAAACASEGQLWDISNPLDPQLLWRVDEPEVQFYHSALFSRDGKLVLFGDEIIFGDCNDGTGSGQIWFHDIRNGRTLGSHQTPRSQVGPEGATYCSAHLFNNIPTNKGRVLVASWYSAGTAVVDYTDPANAKEIAFFDPPDTGGNITSTWASYWYNGFIYANDGTGRVGLDRNPSRGVDIFLFSDKHRAGAGKKLAHLNPQVQ